MVLTLVTAVSSRGNVIPLKGPGNLEVPVSFGNFGFPVGTDFGYFSGGSGSGGNNISAIQRLDFNNDTTTPNHRSNISSGTRYLQSVSSTSHLYVCGGNNTNRSTVDRLDFSNDSVNASVRGPMTQVRMVGTFWKY